MRHGRRLTYVVLAAVLAMGSAFAAKLGDPAAPLSIEEWIKGQPVDLAAGKGKQIFVVEFWATWCPPCRTSIPHLTELQAKYKDKGVTIVGITDEAVEDAKPFVEKMGAQMEYTVAIDDDMKTGRDYMGAFEVDTIPHAFIVDKAGIVAWQGNPAVDDLEGALDQILTGTFDIQAAAKADQARRAEQAEQMATMMLRAYYEMVKEGAETQQADALAEHLITNDPKATDLLNTLAWMILTDKEVKYRNLEMALRAAKAAYDACEGKDTNVVDTYARALFETGKVSQAIEHQKKAIELCQDEQIRPELERTLAEYQSKAAATTS
ncbi:MAG: redoxin domain-containing protein [Candidatus Hydrogenedentes bacterium]|nr:redoxin domain-containing protein [Candidatus Hydrogenedentota bacterium]